MPDPDQPSSGKRPPAPAEPRPDDSVEEVAPAEPVEAAPEPSPEPSPETAEAPDEAPDGEESPASPPPTGRGRLIEALSTPRRSQAVVAALLLVVGFAAVTQVRTTVDDSSYSSSREEDLINILSGLAGATQRAQTQLGELEATKERLEDDTSQRQAAIDQARSQVRALNVLAGLVPVRGPGVEITITEQTGYVKVSDFLDLVEELRSNGAEAIEVNDRVRLVADSYVAAGNDGLVVDGVELTSPYKVTAIGEPAALEQAVTFYGGPGTQLEDDGAAEVEAEESASLEIRSVRP